MALDLEEEFRPVVVDSIVLTAVNRPLFKLGDFELDKRNGDWKSGKPGETPKTNARPVYLKEEARKRFIALYETRINEQIYYPPTGEQIAYRRIFELQAYQIAKVILAEADRYVPMMVR